MDRPNRQGTEPLPLNLRPAQQGSLSPPMPIPKSFGPVKWSVLLFAAFLLVKAGVGYRVRRGVETKRREELTNLAHPRAFPGLSAEESDKILKEELEQLRARANGGQVNADELTSAVYNRYAREHGLPQSTYTPGGGYVIHGRSGVNH